MSMFHELMMRKKEQIMYATIKGTLTENDGVFSGFSASNYLQVQNSLDLTKSWEIQLEFTTGNDISSEQFILADTQNPSPIGFGIFTNSQFVVYYMNTQGQRVYSFIDDLSANTKYKVNLKYSKEEYKFYVYINGVKKVDVASIYSYSNRYIRFGVSRAFTSAFAGSIDLPNSYIKTEATKYKLQAVVGYTVVGSPTITDGVVSGFSGSNYLRLPNFAPTNSWEIVIKGLFITANGDQYFCGFRTADGVRTIIFGTSNNNLKLFVSSNGTSWNITSGLTAISSLVDGNTYWYKCGWTGTQYYIEYSSDGINYIGRNAVGSNLNIQSAPLYLGTAWNADYRWKGTIDLNSTYIKINNKLWFNGQQS